MTARRRAEIEFHLFDVLDIGSFASWPAFTGQDVVGWRDVLGTAERLAETYFAPHNHEADQHEPRLENGKVRTVDGVGEAIRALSEAGFLVAHRPTDEGGLGLPWTLVQGSFVLFQSANISTSAYPFLTIAAANMLAAFGSEAQRARFLPHLQSGRFLATMALSEPQAGSGLADIRTRARPLDDGTYALSGTKQWISGGAHELADTIVHFVLARIEGAAAGVKGISLFIVPRDWVDADGQLGSFNNVALVSLLHKMGYRGTTSTILNFGEAGPCRGFLMGEPNRGLDYMFKMMNEARIGVGLGASALALAGFHYSLDYCATRRQGRALGDKRSDLPPVPINRHPDVKHMLLAQKAYSEGSLGLCLYCAHLVDQRDHAEPAAARRSEALLDILTPVAKAWPSAYGPKANDLAIQCLGGYGYTRDYPVEQLYRDNRLNPIHEGTNGIQALDLLGRKVMSNGGADYRLLRQAVAADLAAAQGDPEAAEIAAAWHHLDRSVEAALASAERSVAVLANASLFLEAFGHATIAWRLLMQARAAARAVAAGRGDSAAARGRRQALKWFIAVELPRVAAMLDLVERCDPVAVETDPAWL